MIPVIDLPATGQNIKQLARARKITVTALGAICHVSRTAVYKWYSGVCMPTVDNLVALSRLFGVAIDDLIAVTEVSG